jgi:eukaryotic-like serine/threonine-protein kinase
VTDTINSHFLAKTLTGNKFQMNNQRWQRVDEIFQTAIELPPELRVAFLEEACSDDPMLRAKVEAMIKADDGGWDLIEKPALEVAAPLLADETPQMARGERIGRYEVDSLIGRGGMGEVYLAKDESLNRRVALKLLPPDYTKYKDRVKRFQQEAQAASALNHPNILTIYEIGQVERQQFIATEFVEGETLRERMNRSSPVLDEVLDITMQVGSALAAAHQAGIVHRDIKPENIMIRPDGYVKLLDFGLAKLTDADPEISRVINVDTTPGLVMGTMKYASPEQVRGLEVDQRSDIFSFGVVLYETITNHSPFEGETTGDLIAAILKEKPAPLTKYVPTAPEQLQQIITRTLAKDKAERYQTIQDLLTDLRRLKEALKLQSNPANYDPSSQHQFQAIPTVDELPALTKSVENVRTAMSAEFVVAEIKRHKLGATIILGVLFITTASVGYLSYRFVRQPKAPLSAQNIMVSRVTTSGKAANAAISPDGKYVAYVTVDGGQQSLWIRQIPTSTNRQIFSQGPAPYWGLTFSPDGNYLYFWGVSKDDSQPSLYQTSSLGGDVRKLISGVENSNSGNNPITFSPDGTHLTFVREYASEESAVVVVNSDGTGERILAKRNHSDYFASAAWSPNNDRIACVVGGSDSKGPYSSVVEIAVNGGTERSISSERWQWIGDLAWTADGASVLITANAQGGESIQIWEISVAKGNARRITTDLNNYSGLSLTADSSALVTTLNDKVMHIWTQGNSNGETAKQITFGTATKDGWDGIGWTPDNRIVYSSSANGNQDIWIMNADGSNQKQLTVNSGSDRFGLSVSPDGRYIVFVSGREDKGHLWRVNTDGSGLKQLTDGSGESDPLVWPDGEWVSYYGPPVLKVSIDGGKPLQVAEQFSDLVSISPDEKLIAYLIADAHVKGRKIGIAPAEGGTPIRIIDLPPTPPRRIQWTPDGRALTYIVNRGRVSNLWKQPIDGGKPEQLTNFSTHFIHSFDWSRDGQQLALARWTVTSDIVLMKNFR